ncbi:MAG: hypothetical protein ABIA63_00910 [bacterium]
MIRNNKILLKSKFLLILIILISIPIDAQEPRTSFFRGSNIYSGLHLEFWNWSNVQTLETVLPIYYSMNLDAFFDGLAIDAVTSPTFALTHKEEANTIFGLAGTKIRTSYNYKNLVIGTFGVQIPTGTNKLSASQTQTVGAIATKQMAFKLSRFNTGLDMDFTASSSYEILEDLVLGASLGFLMHGSFTPTEGMKKYNPGNEFTIALGTDYTIFAMNRKISLYGDFIWTTYTADEYDKKDVFDAGEKITFNLRGSIKLNQYFLNMLGITFNSRGNNTNINNDTTVNKIDAGEELLLSNYIYLLGVKKYSPYAIGKISIYGSNGAKSGSAFILGMGGGGSLALAGNISIKAQAVLELGSMTGSALIGMELSGGINYVF